MIVIDSSVWIAALRGSDTVATRKLGTLTRDAVEDILVGDLILVEILQGARDEKHADAIERRLRKFTVEPMLDPGLAAVAARNYRALRSRGVTIRKTIDLIIATFCIERSHSLLHGDRDFDAAARYLGLRVV